MADSDAIAHHDRTLARRRRLRQAVGVAIFLIGAVLLLQQGWLWMKPAGAATQV